MTPSKLSKHDQYVEDLCSKIKPRYDRILTNVLIRTKKKQRSVVEIDVLAIKGSRMDIYEVKCSRRMVKAKQQLRKVKMLLPDISNMYFYCGESGKVETVS